MIYTADTVSLAALEILVHYSVLPKDFQMTPIEAPTGMRAFVIKEASLPKGWMEPSFLPATQEIGAKWISDNRSLLMDVPSSIVPIGRNLLINPRHPDFVHLKFGHSSPFRFDPRLKQ